MKLNPKSDTPEYPVTLGAIFAVVTVTGLVIVRLLTPYIQGRVHCVFDSLTGIPCPSCGITRSAYSLAGFDIPGALFYNPLFALTSLALILWGIGSTVNNLRDSGDRFEYSPILKKYTRLALPVAVLLNWIYLIVIL